jgi:hypothetical protein
MATKIKLSKTIDNSPPSESLENDLAEILTYCKKIASTLDELKLPSIDDEILLMSYVLISLVSQKDKNLGIELSEKIQNIIYNSLLGKEVENEYTFLVRDLHRGVVPDKTAISKDKWGLDPQLITENH